MYIAGRWADRQLSRLEKIFALIILSFVVFALLQQMLKIFDQAERSMIVTSIMTINTVLQYRAGWYLMNSDYQALESMQGVNPFKKPNITTNDFNHLKPTTATKQMLAGLIDIRLPANYLGEFDNSDIAEIPGGKWYFDRNQSRLIYTMSDSEMSLGANASRRAEFAVKIDYRDVNGNNRFDADVDVYQNIGLKTANDVAWQLLSEGGG